MLGDALASTRVHAHLLTEAGDAAEIEIAAMELLPKADAADASPG